MLSMAVGSIEERLKLVPFCVRGQTVDSEGGVFKNKNTLK